MMNSDGFLTGKTALILGGSSGFGLEIARLMAAEGAQLIIVGRDAAKAEKCAREFQTKGTEAKGYGLDAANPRALQPLFRKIGSVDHVVSMIGGAMGGGFLSAETTTIRDTIEGKFFANLQIARTVAPFIADGGSLTFTGGAGGRPDNASGALIGNEAISTLVRGLAVELAPRVRTNAVAPTWTPTPLWRNVDPSDIVNTRAHFAEMIPLRRTAKPVEVAQAYLFLIRCGFITGQTITVDGGLGLVT